MARSSSLLMPWRCTLEVAVVGGREGGAAACTSLGTRGAAAASDGGAAAAAASDGSAAAAAAAAAATDLTCLVALLGEMPPLANRVPLNLFEKSGSLEVLVEVEGLVLVVQVLASLRPQPPVAAIAPCGVAPSVARAIAAAPAAPLGIGVTAVCASGSLLLPTSSSCSLSSVRSSSSPMLSLDASPTTWLCDRSMTKPSPALSGCSTAAALLFPSQPSSSSVTPCGWICSLGPPASGAAASSLLSHPTVLNCCCCCC
eukprot:CAMPEP_0202396572 /NCGR_PEP_ID=MMETSP1127-20130417/94585_1 /ASSEMBLY_ACC=CAM_ASM_000462 /TAXON_ID=3047 /ORGANISM="Dunaliella tertiolecta, Strain CCMP1320" /LENGTH=256 /DNA_ID=CAMNT_0048999369 /DNA_START=205 /DNA_END=973 /DNA_ORIENTATION=+